MKPRRHDAAEIQKQRSSDKSRKPSSTQPTSDDRARDDIARDSRPGNPKDLRHQQIDESGAPLE